jgi:hypothetical protein
MQLFLVCWKAKSNQTLVYTGGAVSISSTTTHQKNQSVFSGSDADC